MHAKLFKIVVLICFISEDPDLRWELKIAIRRVKTGLIIYLKYLYSFLILSPRIEIYDGNEKFKLMGPSSVSEHKYQVDLNSALIVWHFWHVMNVSH